MPRIIFISGACGCGKTTFADAYARHIVRQERKPVYVIHGDDFHRGFVEPEEKDDFFVDGQAADRIQWSAYCGSTGTASPPRRRGRCRTGSTSSSTT